VDDDPMAADGMSRGSPSQELRDLPVDLIEPNLSQPRRYLDEAALEALAGSVRDRGVLQPVLVRPLKDGKYGLIVGERRWRAAKIAGLQSIPAPGPLPRTPCLPSGRHLDSKSTT